MSDAMTLTASGGTPLSRPRALPYASPMTGETDDAALMLRFRDGDAEAFRVLYLRHKDPVYRYLLRMSMDTHHAEDLMQEVWSRIITSRRRYRPTARFTTFLYRIAHNCFIDFARRRSRRGHEQRAEEVGLADAGPRPEEAAELALARRRLDAALAALPAEQRDAYLLREEAGLGIEAIAAVTGVERETAKSRLRYAVSKLRHALAEPSGRATGGGP